MAELTVKTTAGKASGTVTVTDANFGIQPNVPVMHQVVTAQLARRRAGTQSTKTRSEVRGGGAKPYRQKGTGNARQGSTNSPHYAGGGVALGPKPRSYAQKTPKKMIRLALRSALSDRANDDKVVVVDQWTFDAPRTKLAAAALEALGLAGRSLVIYEPGDEATERSFRNLPGVQLIRVSELNAYDVLANDNIVFTKSALESFEAQNAARDEKKATASERSATAEKPAKAATPAPAAAVVEADEADETTDAPEIQGFANLAADDTEADDTAASDTVQPTFGFAGSAPATDDGEMPAGYPIKGNADSMLYHLPDGQWYDATIAELWFDTEESAAAAGFRKAGSSS